MRKFTLVMALLLSAAWNAPMIAQDAPVAAEQPKPDDVQKQLDELKELVRMQGRRIQDLEAKLEEEKTARIIGVKQKIAEGEKSTWLPSMKSEMVEIGGELEFEFKTHEEDHDPLVRPFYAGGTTGTFDMDKANIHMNIKWTDRLWTFFEIENFEGGAEGDTHVDAAFAQFDLVKSDQNAFFVRAGLDHRFTKYSRSTENYPIAGAVWWRDENSQLRIGGHHAFNADKKWLYWNAYVGNTFVTDSTTSALGENAVLANDILQDDNDDFQDFDGNFEFGFGVGVDPDFKEYGKFDLGVWYITSDMRDDIAGRDVDEISDLFYTPNGLPTHMHPSHAGVLVPGVAGDDPDQDKHHFGARLVYTNKFMEDKLEFKTIWEYIDASDGPVDRDSWYGEAGVSWKVGGIQIGDEKYFTKINPLVRFEDYDVDSDFDNQIDEPVTWDRDRWMIALNLEMTKNSLLRFEYSINGEEIDHLAGGRLNDSTVDDVDNDEFLIQWELKF